MELQCQFLIDPEQGQTLLVLTATPGTRATSCCNCSR